MRALLALLGLSLLLACSSSQRPWKVSYEDERRYEQAREACEMLTDTAEHFESCMKRRGFRREYPFGL